MTLPFSIKLGRCPKPRRSGLAILRASPRGLRYRLMAMILGRCPKPRLVGAVFIMLSLRCRENNYNQQNYLIFVKIDGYANTSTADIKTRA